MCLHGKERRAGGTMSSSCYSVSIHRRIRKQSSETRFSKLKRRIYTADELGSGICLVLMF